MLRLALANAFSKLRAHPADGSNVTETFEIKICHSEALWVQRGQYLKNVVIRSQVFALCEFVRVCSVYQIGYELNRFFFQ